MSLYNLYPSVLISRGYTRSVLLDIAKGLIHYFPNDLLSRIENSEFKNLNLESFSKDEREFLIEKELVFGVDVHNADCFPRINFDWFFPAKITNIVFELSDINAQNLHKLIEFEGAAHINFVLRSDCEKNSIDKVIKFFRVYECDSCEFTLLENIDIELLSYLESSIVDVKKCIVVNNWADYNFGYKDKAENDFEGSRMLDFNDSIIPISITKNLMHFTEAQEHHTYFNQKLYFGTNGEIKNSLESILCFGQLQGINNANKLIDIIESKKFKEHWTVKKTETDVCRDCEFKYLCTDNRLPIKRSNGAWFHGTECKYNPYIAKWQGQEGYRTLENVGVFSNEHGFEMNDDEIQKTNSMLWDD